MSVDHDSIVTTWSNTGTTLGAVGLIAIIAQGSADQTLVQIKDSSTVKYAPVIATTSLAGFIFSHQPVAFRNLVTSISGTGSYSITYYPRP